MSDQITRVEVDCSGTLPEEDRVRVIPLTDEEVTAREAEAVDDPVMRSIRDGLLRQSDWTQLPDAPLTAATRALWKKWRQELRDNPAGPWSDPPD